MSAKDVFDVVIVGSGAAGGMAAHELSLAGAKVLMLEGGRDYDPITETPMFQTQEDAPLRASSTPHKDMGYYDATVDGGWEIPGEPYTVRAGSEFRWWRPRMLGGRTNHWGRVSLRFGPYDFKPYSRDGLGFDWPIDYSQVAPWYDRVERLIGVTGAAHGFENTPDSPPGVLQTPPPLRAHELFLARVFEHMGLPVAAIHAAVLTQPLNGRPPCLYATPCTRGCSIRANFQSTTVLIPPARTSGNLTVRCNAMVYKVDVERDGRAKGVTFIDRQTGQHHAVFGRVVVLAAGACSSARIMMNSNNAQFPTGIGNTAGKLGKYLLDTVEFTMQAQVPALERIPPQNDDGIFTPHIYVPWWGYQQQKHKELDFPRGYHIEPRGGRRMPTMGVGNYIDNSSSMYGLALRDEITRKYGSYIFLSGEGEMIPNDDTYCDLDPAVKDKWGIPVLRFQWKWGDAEIKQCLHMRKTFNAIFKTMGATALDNSDDNAPLTMPIGGAAIHEVGCVRMGPTDGNSCVDQYGQCWDVKNVFVADGGTFASSPDKNPTLTILALAARTSDYIAQKLRSGEL